MNLKNCQIVNQTHINAYILRTFSGIIIIIFWECKNKQIFLNMLFQKFKDTEQWFQILFEATFKPKPKLFFVKFKSHNFLKRDLYI